jgi:hypothetical protein
MIRCRNFSIAGACLLLAANLAFAEEPIETFTAFGAHMDAGKTSQIQMAVTRWSTDEERQMLLKTLAEKGQPGLIEELSKLPAVGYIRLPGTIGRDLHYARQTAMPDGTRRVIIATDRPLHFREALGGRRSDEYDFTFVEMRFSKDGKGEGKLAMASMIGIDKEKKQLVLENYGQEPIRLINVISKTK